jgi:hypothetical protein
MEAWYTPCNLQKQKLTTGKSRNETDQEGEGGGHGKSERSAWSLNENRIGNANRKNHTNKSNNGSRAKL